MKISKLLRVSYLLPMAWFTAFRNDALPFEQRYASTQKWSKRILKALGYRLHVKGSRSLEKAEKIYFVSNHQGTLDPALICASCPIPLSFVSKSKNEKIPILGHWARNIECIHFDKDTREGNIHMLREVLRYLKKNRNILIFPEGTRSKCDAMNPFMDKALQPAIIAKATIVPITLNYAYCLDNKNFKGKDLYIAYGNPIEYNEYKDLSLEQVSQMVQRKIQQEIRI